MNGELTAAVKRLTAETAYKCRNGELEIDDESDPTGYVLRCGHWDDDATTVIEAYLAEHPADDGEPVSVEWLRDSGWVESPNPRFVNSPGTAVRLAWSKDENRPFERTVICHGDTELFLPGITTRGHVRRLLVALGIPSPAG